MLARQEAAFPAAWVLVTANLMASRLPGRYIAPMAIGRSPFGGRRLPPRHFRRIPVRTLAPNLVTLLALGFVGRSGHRWAFLTGMVLYGADMIALMATFSLWAFGVHAFFVFKWFQGQKALKDLNDPGVSSF